MPGPIDLHQEVAVPADVVWSVITDIDNAAATISGIQSVERLDDLEAFGVGTRWRETRVMFGRSATEELTVTHVEPGTSYTTTAIHDKVRYTSTLSVHPTGPQTCVLRMHFDAQTSGFMNKTLGALVGLLMQSSTRKLMRQDLTDIAAAAQATAA